MHDCYDCGADAEWRQTHIGQSEFLEWLHGQEYVSAFWSLPGVTIDYVKPDFMHTVCLGIACYVEGNCMWELLRALGGTWDTAERYVGRLLTLVDLHFRA